MAINMYRYLPAVYKIGQRSRWWNKNIVANKWDFHFDVSCKSLQKTSLSTEILRAKQPPASNHTVSASHQVTGYKREMAVIVSFHSSS